MESQKLVDPHKANTIEISQPPKGLEKKYKEIFTDGAVQFLTELVATFQCRENGLHRSRKLHRLLLDESNTLPEFMTTKPKPDPGLTWQINPLPPSLLNRHLDLGDISPSNPERLKVALQASTQGIQLDFDDGHCPSWRNMIEGIHNVIAITRGQFYPDEVPPLDSLPILMMRPRAWNMNEHNILVNGKEIAGPLMDFGLLTYHIGTTLAKSAIGPFFYLSKLEGASEARLWNDIFLWSQAKLGIPRGTIKACVLIENLFAAFEMEQILFELREHSLGLNCGIWDYCASIVNIFGDRKAFILPDRNKYVSLEKPFLSTYMKLVVQTCHRHGAPATGGMSSLVLNSGKVEGSDEKIRIEAACQAKIREIHLGVDGILVYDHRLVPIFNELWKKVGPNQISSVLHSDFEATAADLLMISPGGITTQGLVNNIKVSILYIYSWLADATGLFTLNGLVEDSATAEISRTQIAQWILHRVGLEDGTKDTITKTMVTSLAVEFYKDCSNQPEYSNNSLILEQATQIFLEIVSAFYPTEFITTFLYNHSIFRAKQQT